MYKKENLAVKVNDCVEPNFAMMTKIKGIFE